MTPRQLPWPQWLVGQATLSQRGTIFAHPAPPGPGSMLRSCVQPAVNTMSRSNRLSRREFVPTTIHYVGTACSKWTAFREFEDRGRLTLDCLHGCAISSWKRTQQPTRVGMRGRLHQSPSRARLHRFAGVHHDDTGAD